MFRQGGLGGNEGGGQGRDQVARLIVAIPAFHSSTLQRIICCFCSQQEASRTSLTGFLNNVGTFRDDIDHLWPLLQSPEFCCPVFRWSRKVNVTMFGDPGSALFPGPSSHPGSGTEFKHINQEK